MEISNKYKINHINLGISNRDFLDFNKTTQIVNIMKNAQKPLLIHCAGGADRTSLAAALYQYAIKNKSVEESKEEFSIIYGHSPYFRKHVIAMDNSFENFIEYYKGKK
jgi:protein tyrosine/serine phosphatase